MGHAKVKGTEVLVEWHVGKIVVNVEEESVVDVSGRGSIRNPVQFIYMKQIPCEKISLIRAKVAKF